ncbi:penicillin-binding protein PBP2A [Streptococcus zalophi]|uniref:PBP1A family penicillin-binding protein n=1 Tax=Streptococcus zalophi TaxID=640031 RepID=A0A934UDZ0_9STRE|nr:penicillin-binding protein PBP2A [Streptococcus zalophi]MBJ8350178.1 PBP1A family penicillin-binding protein [Streptococcus zalophi]
MTILDVLKKKFFPEDDNELTDKETIEASTTEEDETLTRTESFERRSSYQRSKPVSQKEVKPKGFFHRFQLSPNNPIRKFWRRYNLTKILVIVISTFVLLISGYLFYLAKTANVSNLESALRATTVIYDRDGEYAGALSGQKGSYVELDAISDDLENAVIATEDRSFYDNNGINFQRTLLAVLTLGRSGGGSTITQQLAKNAYLTQDQTIKRKAREFFLALELTKKYSKDNILTMYLNNSYFGNGVWGVEDASQKYFGVSASQLSLDEAATLAGMLKGPEIYNPYYSIENATNRRNTVLQAMVDAGKIEQSVADEYMAVNMESRLSDTYTGKVDDYRYPSYFDAVINEAIEEYGLTEKDIVNNGYKIYTALDQNYQIGMQETFNNDALFPVSYEDGTSVQGASVALDPKDGGVRGLVGRVNSSEETIFRSFNYATQAQRSPASTIKPLMVYSPAIASGWQPERELPNMVQDFDGYTPHNYGGFESESVPMYQALANSYNIPAVYTVKELGINKAFSYGEKFGLNLSKTKKELGVALGSGVSTNPLEMAQAYAAFANNGVMPKAHLITRIETASGKVLKEFKESSTKVLSQSETKKMTSMMLGTFSNGTGVNANVYGYTLAGKTGTTEADFNPDLATDQWVIGYTPDVVISQWIGFDKPDESHYLTDSSAGTASTIFSVQASYILPYTEGTSFSENSTYEENGISAVTNTEIEEQSQGIIDSLQESVQEAAKNIRSAVDESGIVERIQDTWQDIVDYFR